MNNGNYYTVLLILFANWISCNNENEFKIRDKRALIFPGPLSQMRFIIGAGVPVDLEDETVIIGMSIRCIYLVPINSSLYTNPSITISRKKRSLSRWNIYEVLSKLFDTYGYGGKACLLRAICDMADIPIDRSSGVLAELFHAILTPTTTQEEIRDYSDNEYYAAHQIGHEMKGACQHFFPECRISFVDMFTRLRIKTYQ